MLITHQLDPRKPQLTSFHKKQEQTKANKSHPSQFMYRRGTKYISISEEKTITDHYSQYFHIQEEKEIVKSYLLNEELFIVWEGIQPRDLESQLLIKQQKQNYCDEYPKLPKLSFETYKLNIQKPALTAITYKKYPELNSFMIGRQNFVRKVQSHKIQSDLVSMQHCQINLWKKKNEIVSNYLKTIKRILTLKSSLLSGFRRLPHQIMEQIFQFVKPRQKYIFTDLGSRNGSWAYEMGTQIYRMQQKLEYQFEKETYSICVMKIFTSRDSQCCSVAQHNVRAQLLIEQYKKQVNWNYYERANKIMLLQNFQNQSSEEKIQVLIFKIKYRDCHEYYLMAVKQSCSEKHSIGCKYDIDINPEEYDVQSLHGKIYQINGTWMIESSELKIDGLYRKLWTKVSKDYKYIMNPKRKYQLRLSSSFFLNVDFRNF